MTPFWLGTGLLLLLVVALLGWPAMRSRAGWRSSAWVPVIAVPIAAMAIYFASGRPGLQEIASQADVPTIDEMVASLAARLEDDPSDVQGWRMLGRSYFQIGKYWEAVDAFEQALRYTPEPTTDLKLDYAEALLRADRDSILGRAGALIEEILIEAPDDMLALLYGGVGALMRGEQTVAVQRWQRVLEMNPPEELAATLHERLAALGAGTAAAETPNTEVPRIEIRISLGGDIPRERFSNAQSLWVFASTGSGSMPVAALEIPEYSLPASVWLSDADVILPGNSLGNYATLTIGARLSMSGGAIRASGDLQGESTIAMADGGPVSITLDTIVP